MNTIKKVMLSIGGIVILAVFGFFVLGNDSQQKNSTDPDAIIADYKQLLAEAEATTRSAGSDCADKKGINQQIDSMGKKLTDLISRKNKWLDNKQTEPEFIPDLPPLPGEEVPDLGDPTPDPAQPVDAETEFIPDLPPLPGEETPDLGDSTPDAEPEFIPDLPPLPGEEVPDLGDPTPDPAQPVDAEPEFIPDLPPLPWEEAPDLGGPTDIDVMNALEKSIISELNDLRTLCKDEEKTSAKKKAISDTCNDACQRYRSCAAYTEDVTSQDLDDAYTTCMEECATWGKKIIICINAIDIKNPGDCVSFVNCQLPQFYEKKYLQ